MVHNEDELWRRIVKVHNWSKQLLIRWEEASRQQWSFLAPIIQERDALEHIVRAQAVTVGMNSGRDQEYVRANLDKALGHIYRAFFDTADWMAIGLRADIASMLEPYSNEGIKTVLPSYYTQIRPQLETINQEIANIRGAKDVGDEDIFKKIEQYYTQVEKLLDFRKTVVAAIPSLEEYRKKEDAAGWKAHVFELFLVFLGAVLALVVERIIGKH
jgi:hypothetical protein